MGGNNVKPVEEEVDLSTVDISQDTDLQLIQDQIQSLFKFKILLLGAGESGKSTVVKQIKLLHKKELTDHELHLTANSLHQNVIDCIKAIINARRLFNIPLDEESQKLEKDFLAWEASPATIQKKPNLLNDMKVTEMDAVKRISPELGAKIIRLFNSDGIKRTYQRRSEFWLLDSFSYYIQNLNRFVQPNFIPTEEDAIMARIRTTGIVVTELEHKIPQDEKDFPDTLHFQVVDVGGQRNERKKWIHCFDDVKAVLFCDNLAGYNQVLFEDNKKNRMHESLELFSKVTFNPVFRDTPIFLFLNKRDLFEAMIREVDMKVTFPEYKGGTDYSKALSFVEDMFKKQANEKEIQVQVLAACWKREVMEAFEEVKKFLYDKNKEKIKQQVKELRQRQKEIILNKRKAEQAKNSACC